MSPVSGESKGVGVQGPGFPSPLNMEIYTTNLPKRSTRALCLGFFGAGFVLDFVLLFICVC